MPARLCCISKLPKRACGYLEQVPTSGSQAWVSPDPWTCVRVDRVPVAVVVKSVTSTSDEDIDPERKQKTWGNDMTQLTENTPLDVFISENAGASDGRI